MTKYSGFIHSAVAGTSTYVSTGRTDPLFRRSFRHMFRAWGHTHFMPGMLVLSLVILYCVIETRPIGGSLLRMLFHWGVAVGWIAVEWINS